MIKFLFTLILFVATAASAVTGDITSVTIDTNGWNCFVVFSGMGTNSPTFNNGMGGIVVDGQCLVTNLIDPLTAKFKLWVSSPGFDATGTSNYTTRLVYGTKLICKVYPDNALADTDGTGGNAKLNIALSEHITTNDTVSFDIAAGAYSNGGTNSIAASGSCVNNSIIGYPNTFLNHTDYGWNSETNAVMTVRAFAFGFGAHDGKPVACMRCDVSNALSESWTTNITVMELTRGRNGTEMLPVGEYVARVPLSGFTQGSKLIVNWKAFPWIGNAQSLANTGDGTHIMPSANAAPITNVCNKTLGYGTVCAVVSPTSGNDGNGRCATNGDPTTISSGQYFATIGAALNIAMGSNNTYFSHNDIGGVNIYINDASPATYMQAAKAYGARPDVYATIQPYPGTSASISNNATGSSSQPTMVRFKGPNLTINPGSAAGSLVSTSNNNWGVWIFDSATLSAPNTTQVNAPSSSQSYSLVYVVDCAVPCWGQGFICKGAGAKDTYPLLRGCNLNGFTNIIMAGVRIGNYITQTNAGPNFPQFVTDTASQGSEVIDPQIDYNNFWGCQQLNSSATMAVGINFNITNGYFFGNNAMEFSTNSNGSARWNFGTSNGKNYTNLCFVDNTIIGCAAQFAYNDDTTSPSWRIWERVENCYIDNFDFKSYAFTGGASGASGLRIGNRSVDYGTDFACNVFNETSGLQSSASFLLDFGGLNYIGVNVDNGNTAGGRAGMCGALVGFVNPQCFDGTTVHTGNGDYRWKHSSLVHRIKRIRVLLPYDLWGNQRGDMSPIGAFSEADLNK